MTNTRIFRDKTLVSVIIPMLNEERVIGQCLQSLVRQDLPADLFEVILVDNGSTDRSIEIASSYEQSLTLIILRKEGAHVSGLRNLGAASANGEFLAFLDADCVAPPDWLRRALELLRADGSGVMGSFYRVPAASSWVAKTWYEDLPAMKSGPVSYVPAGDLLVSRNAFLKLGGFDQTIETSEDCEFCQRAAAAGLRVVAVPQLSVVHLGTPQTVSAFYRKQRWHGTHVHKVFLKDIAHSRNAKTVLFTLYALGCLLAAAASVPIALLSSNIAALFVAPLCLLAGSFLLSVRAAAQRRRWRILAPLTLLYAVYGVARATCFLGITSARRAQPVSRGALDGTLRNRAAAESLK